MSEIQTHTLPNGLKLLLEPMAGVESVGMTTLLPAGAACEPADRLGIGEVLSEMLFRGAGDLDARGHSDALDRLGIQRGCEVGVRHLRLSATMLGERVEQALPLLLDMVCRPQLPETAFDAAKDLALQGLETLEDEPQQKVMLELRKQHLPPPFGRSPLGEREGIQPLTLEEVRTYQQRRFVPGGSVIALAGRIDPDEVRTQIETLLGDWSGKVEEPTTFGQAPGGYRHVTADTAQQHIGIAFDAVPEPDPASMIQRLAVATLSGGMSGRLFTEVREKRGLCYAVYAAYLGMRDRGLVLSYAGTTTERAPETLEVLRHELQRLSEGVDQDEFDRAVVGLKARLVMQGESTSARAAAIASDLVILGSPRTLDQLAGQIDAVTLDRLNAFLAEHRPERMTTLTVGPEPLA